MSNQDRATTEQAEAGAMLLPCPFCGSAAERDPGWGGYVKCTDMQCVIGGPIDSETQWFSERFWNTRHAIDALTRKGGDGMFAQKFIEWNRSRPEPYVRVGFEMVVYEHFLQYETRSTEAVDSVDAARYRWLRDWYLKGGKRSEIDPIGHIRVQTESTIDAGIDAAIAAAPRDGG